MKCMLILMGLSLSGGIGAKDRAPSEASSWTNPTPEAIDAYWTEERMRRAAGSDGVTGTASPFPSLESPAAMRGAPTTADVSKRPFSIAGRLFFTNSAGQDASCSGAFVGHRRVVLTAAHCLGDKVTRAHYTNFLFVQAYRNGTGQRFTSNFATIWRQGWIANPNAHAAGDYGFLVTDIPSPTGFLQLKLNLPYKTWHAVGYPLNIGSGEAMQLVEGTEAARFDTVVIMQGNSMGPGSSGGPMIAELTVDGHTGNYAVGVNALASAQAAAMYTPLFNSQTQLLFEHALEYATWTDEPDTARGERLTP